MLLLASSDYAGQIGSSSRNLVHAVTRCRLVQVVTIWFCDYSEDWFKRSTLLASLLAGAEPILQPQATMQYGLQYSLYGNLGVQDVPQYPQYGNLGVQDGPQYPLYGNLGLGCFQLRWTPMLAAGTRGAAQPPTQSQTSNIADAMCVAETDTCAA